VIRDPVLRGFNPDPSITRFGEDYYLATSTLVWQPGIRLFHSTDLASWTLIGHGLKTGGHDLRGLASHQGIWAPCLTFSEAEGLLYLTYSLVRSTTEYFDVNNLVVRTSLRASSRAEPPVGAGARGGNPESRGRLAPTRDRRHSRPPRDARPGRQSLSRSAH
jgi:beta-xylosidase